MQNVFTFRDNIIDEYSIFSRSFSKIAAHDIIEEVEKQYSAGRYWPEPLIQINPNYLQKGGLQSLVDQGLLHPGCIDIFQRGKSEGHPTPINLYAHQLEAIAKANNQSSYVVTTGTGSGKSLAFFIPIIDRILKAKSSGEPGRTRAIVIYPMNALANSQLEELNKFLHGYQDQHRPFTVARYTGQERKQIREGIAQDPPDILLTNFMMLELILTRYESIDRQVVKNCRGLEFLVLDELHTYRGRQGADVAMLVRRLRQRLGAEKLICIGTSATMSTKGTAEDQQKTVAEVASKLFGASITAHDVITETLDRVTDPSLNVEAIKPLLAGAIKKSVFNWPEFESFRSDPLAIWVELLADQSSLVHDFAARQKVGGTHLKYHVKKQLPTLPPERYSEADLAFIVPRVLELTYTSYDLQAWAEDLGYTSPPFPYNPERRAQLRAELDAYYARLYGLTRDELRYILDPTDIMGEDYPSETFRVLKNNDIRNFGEYRTQRLVLAAWDRL